MKERTFEQKYYQAEYIKSKKQKEWLEITKKHLPNHIAEHLFYPKYSTLADMLKIDPNKGFVYDPETLRNGIDLLIKILTLKDSKSTSLNKFINIYKSFEDPKIRVNYLRQYIDYLDLYPILGGQVIADLETIAPSLTNPEEIEINTNIINNIKARFPEFANPGYQPE